MNNIETQLIAFIYIVLIGAYIFAKIVESNAKGEYLLSKAKYYDSLTEKIKHSKKRRE